MSLGKKVFAAPARLWMNWPLWGGLLAVLLLTKHVWVLFAPAEHAIPGTTVATQSAQAEQLFGTVSTTTSSASLNGIRPIGIFASRTKGFAVLMTESGQVGVGLGGEVVPGVRLVETQPQYVILERNGVRQRVDLSLAPAAMAAVDGLTVTALTTCEMFTVTVAVADWPDLSMIFAVKTYLPAAWSVTTVF